LWLLAAVTSSTLHRTVWPGSDAWSVITPYAVAGVPSVTSLVGALSVAVTFSGPSKVPGLVVVGIITLVDLAYRGMVTDAAADPWSSQTKSTSLFWALASELLPRVAAPAVPRAAPTAVSVACTPFAPPVLFSDGLLSVTGKVSEAPSLTVAASPMVTVGAASSSVMPTCTTSWLAAMVPPSGVRVPPLFESSTLTSKYWVSCSSAVSSQSCTVVVPTVWLAGMVIVAFDGRAV
jgi:hypothetical protein